MNRHDTPVHRLPADQALTLATAPGQVLRVLAGRLWLTQSGQPDDRFVSAGQTWVLGPGRTVVQADAGPARYTVGPAPAPSAVRATPAWPVLGRRLTSP
ncbi:DUF2917 domain-containing protein [Macromonas nakdongensis]|uniref:DUF2917 domain-containing protein n=1 Tax=Macromonas nakdongensis TaxID=1843082 RepID=UPI000C34F80D|nr:DUF2917 domain-containing protein [Macromonas nakdongensis]